MGIDRHRHVYATAFEREGDGYVFYADAFARGVAVNAAERDLYLDGARSDFDRAIIGREPSFPRRPYWPGLRRLARAVIGGHDEEEDPPSPRP